MTNRRWSCKPWGASREMILDENDLKLFESINRVFPGTKATHVRFKGGTWEKIWRKYD